MPFRDVSTRIRIGIPAQCVVLSDLIRRQNFRRLQVRGQVNVPQFLSRLSDCLQRRAKVVIRDGAVLKVVLELLFKSYEVFPLLDGFGLHVLEKLFDCRNLRIVKWDLIFQFQQVRRPWHAVEFRGFGQPPSAAAPLFREVVR